MVAFASQGLVGNPILTELRGISMLERFKRTGDQDVAERRSGATATAERPDDTLTHEPDTVAEPAERTEPAERPHVGAATAAALETARARQRAQFGGVNWGASFFGWLVAVGIAALLTSLLVAAGAAIGLNESDVTTDADEINLGGGIALIAVLVVAYCVGGYVAGRMSRFDGARQGLSAWLIGLMVTVVLAVAGALLGAEYNVLDRLDLPALPIGDTELATGGALALAVVLVGTLLAAMVGGKAGERYHRRVDRAGFVD
jgi:hypothetical protein